MADAQTVMAAVTNPVAAYPPLNPIATRAATDALANVGVSEDGPPYDNRGRDVETYLDSVGLGAGNPWCAAFVFYRLRVAARELGVPLPISVSTMLGKGAAASWAEWGRARRRWYGAGSGYHPRRGDLACFYIESENGIHHIGIVLDSDGDGVTTVEGNSHPDGVASRDGYCVAKRARAYSAFGARGGFVTLGF